MHESNLTVGSGENRRRYRYTFKVGIAFPSLNLRSLLVLLNNKTPHTNITQLQPTKKNQESERRSIPGPMARTVFDPAETWFKITVKSRYWPKQKKKPKNKTERERVHSNTIVTLSFSKKMRENLVRSQNTLNIHNHVEH